MDHDVTIVGGGVIGCAIARELMRFQVRALLLEALVVALCTALRDVTVRAPVRLGDVVLADALGTGVDVVASRDLPEVAHRAAAAAHST